MQIAWKPEDIEPGTIVVFGGYGVGDHSAIAMLSYARDAGDNAYGCTAFSDGRVYHLGSKNELADYLTKQNARPLSTMEQEKVMAFIYSTSGGWSHEQKRAAPAGL